MASQLSYYGELRRQRPRNRFMQFTVDWPVTTLLVMIFTAWLVTQTVGVWHIKVANGLTVEELRKGSDGTTARSNGYAAFPGIVVVDWEVFGEVGGGARWRSVYLWLFGLQWEIFRKQTLWIHGIPGKALEKVLDAELEKGRKNTGEDT